MIEPQQMYMFSTLVVTQFLRAPQRIIAFTIIELA